MGKNVHTPEELNNKFIQSIGINSLLSTPSSRDREIAERLEKYQLSSSTYEKWVFLARQHKSLNYGSPLAITIQRLFRTTFKQQRLFTGFDNPDPRVISISRATGGRGSSASPYVTFSPLFIGEQMESMVYSFYCQKYVSQHLPLPLDKESAVEDREIKDKSTHRHYRFLKVFLENTIQRINNRDDEKSQQFRYLLLELKAAKKTINIEKLVQLTQTVTGIAKDHRDTGWMGFFKCTWARDTKSFKTINSVFDEDYQLRF